MGIVARVASQLKKHAVAAINGDFFVIKSGPYQGDPRGLQIAQGELVSRPMGSWFWVTAGGELKIGPVESKLRVLWPDGKVETTARIERGPRRRRSDPLHAHARSAAQGNRPRSRRPPAPRVEKNSSFSARRPIVAPASAGTKYSAKVVEVRTTAIARCNPTR